MYYCKPRYTVDSEMFARILILRILRMAFSPQKLNPANKGFNMYANGLGIGRGQRSAKYKLRKHAQEAGTAKLSTRKYFRIYSIGLCMSKGTPAT